IVRRLVIAPVAVALCLSLVAFSPVLLLGAVVADLVAGGGWRTVRVTTFCVVYLAFEILAIVVLFLLWIGSGFGLRIRSERWQEAHFRFMRWWLRAINGAASALFRLRIEIEDRPKPQ